MKRISIIVLIVLSVLFVSCTPKQLSDKTDEYISFIDDAGRNVTLTQKPKKVAVLFSSHAQMVLIAGGNVDITVGESVERGFVSEDTALVDEGAGKKINTELLLSYCPDFVIGSFDISEHNKTAELLDEIGIPTALFHVDSFFDYERVMKILCGIFDTENRYYEHVEKVKSRIDEVLEKIPEGEPKKILFVRCATSAKATKAKTKENNFVCHMLSEMNTYNIAENAPILLDGLSIEEILKQNPDYIFFSPMGNETSAKQYMMSVMQEKEWQMLDAVKNENYTFLNKELFQYKPNNRWDEAYKILAELLYGKK